MATQAVLNRDLLDQAKYCALCQHVVWADVERCPNCGCPEFSAVGTPAADDPRWRDLSQGRRVWLVIVTIVAVLFVLFALYLSVPWAWAFVDRLAGWPYEG